MKSPKELAINLLKLWIACVLVYSVGSSIYISYQQVIVGNDPTVFVSGYHWISFGLMALFFLPMLCKIYHLAKQSDSALLRKVVFVMLIWLLILLGLFALCAIWAYVSPNTFT